MHEALPSSPRFVPAKMLRFPAVGALVTSLYRRGVVSCRPGPCRLPYLPLAGWRGPQRKRRVATDRTLAMKYCSTPTALVALLFAILMVVGCAQNRPYVWVQSLSSSQLKAEQMPIRRGDKLSVFVRGQEQLSGEFEVSADGTYVQPLVGTIPVEGLRPSEAAVAIRNRLRGVIQNPQVTVSLAQSREPLVSVVGEVRTPGHFAIAPGDGVLSALARAGGMTEFADEDSIYVLRRNPKPMRIRFRYDDLAGGDQVSNEFELRDGDVVVVE